MVVSGRVRGVLESGVFQMEPISANRQAFCRAMKWSLSQGRALSQRRSKRAVDLLFIQGPFLDEENQNHKSNREKVSGSAQENKANRGLFRQNQCGNNPLCGVLL